MFQRVRNSGSKQRNLRGLRSLFGAALVVGSFASAHDVIGTTVTWDREMSRIVYSRCATCHHPSGSAFSLITYAEARAWAPAIKDAVLQRRMPPWGAVKGFGDFRNDEALTAEQLELVAKWVDGGLPEGDPRDLPRLPVFADARSD